MNRRHISLRAALALLVLGAAVGVPATRTEAISYATAGYPYADFNRDGFGDLAVGAPGESIGSVRDAGMVHVFYGSEGGFNPASSQAFHQASANVDGVPQTGDHFGQSLAPGDFNGDGFDDLAIGIPGEKLGGTPDTGLVYILNGSVQGLRTAGARSLRQGTVGIGGTSETGDRFGASLAVGNFDANTSAAGRPVDDLAIGVPGEDFNNRTDAGVVQVLYGTAGAGVFGRDETISQDSSGMDGSSNSGDRFGWSLASGNWNGDGASDLAIGVPFETVHDRREEGVVFSILGTSGTGLQTTRSQIMSQDTIFNTAEGHAGEHFGFALAAGDFDSKAPRRTFDDLAIGVPGDLPSNSGAVNIVYGTEHSFELVGKKYFQGKAAGGGAILGSKESGDEFGAVLTAADLTADGAADLVIGVPGEDVDSANGVGGVHVILSNGTELDPAFGPNEFVTQDTRGVPGTNESGDTIGAAIGATDFDGNGAVELLVGCPGEDLGRATDAGAALVFKFVRGDDGWSLLTQDTKGVAGNVESNDRFGESAR